MYQSWRRLLCSDELPAIKLKMPIAILFNLSKNMKISITSNRSTASISHVRLFILCFILDQRLLELETDVIHHSLQWNAWLASLAREFVNLLIHLECQLALRRSQINALKSIFPQLDHNTTKHLPRNSQDLGNGYVFLRPRDRYAQQFSREVLGAMDPVCNKEARQWWGRLQLPNGQIARSFYSESKRVSDKKRISRNVKVLFSSTLFNIPLYLLNN